ncbi:DUF305 domain-containing protein [Streptosporangium pseudovulgare]|uniref:DUF305 domain-containing protein n=1 Tax=Streptosporangium pseudovulgare TaxID=35765 RepID=A0ABQ2QYY5_9ACTN|nr:DUF305 domain-containing protein [Streptosporangium pseudovulgare]GGQ01001.1 hypothetical protein GCM10010140_33970 [Streptosporangium pseudovulgare]
MKRIAWAVPGLVLCAALVTGCGTDAHEFYGAGPGHGAHGGGSAAASAPAAIPATTPPGDVNAVDVMFLQMMGPHNGQGVRLARLARDRPARPEVRTLAAAIATTQEAETATMAGWLRAWGRPLTADPGEHAAHGGMPGLTEAEIGSVADAPPAEFERRFLNMVIAQQDDAIQLARLEAMNGVNPEVRALAGRIEASRTAQIQRMLALLGR